MYRPSRLLVAVGVVLVPSLGNAGAIGFSPLADLAIRETRDGVSVYVADPKNGALLEGRASGVTLLGPADLRRLEECGRFSRPTALALRGSSLVIVDAGSVPSIVECNLDTLQVQVRWRGEPLRAPASVAMTGNGSIVVADTGLRALFIVSPDGKPQVVSVAELPLRVRADERGVLYVQDPEAGILRADTTDARGYASPSKRIEQSALPPVRMLTAFDVFRDVIYTADPTGVRVTVPSAQLTLAVPRGLLRPSTLAVSEHYLAVLDADALNVDVQDRPLAAEVVLDHLAGNPNQAWLELLEYLASRRLLPTHSVRILETEHSYADVLVREGVVVETVSIGPPVPPDRVNTLFCALNESACSAGFAPSLGEVVVPQATLSASLDTGSVTLVGSSVRELVDQRVALAEQRRMVTAEYLDHINPAATRTLESELARLGFITATPMSGNLVPGTLLQVAESGELVLGTLSSGCSVVEHQLSGSMTVTSVRTSFPSVLDAPAAAIPERLRGVATRLQIQVSGWRREAMPLSWLAQCRPTDDPRGAYVISEALSAAEVRILDGAKTTPLEGPLYLGYKVVPLSGLIAGVAQPITDLQRIKPLPDSRVSSWTKTSGQYTLPLTRWRADVLLPARDYYSRGNRLWEIRERNGALDLSARERLGFTPESVGLFQLDPTALDVKTALSDATKKLRKTINYSDDVALAAGTESVYIGIVERSQSVNRDQPGFAEADRSAWYEIMPAVGLVQHRSAPGGMAMPPGASNGIEPVLTKLVIPSEHGTHVAGIIGARDTALTPGLLPHTNLFLVPGDSLADLKRFIEEARSEGILLFNMSLGFPPDDVNMAKLHERIARNWLDSLFIVAAGNGGQDLNATGAALPAAWAAAGELPNVMTVGASDEDGENILGDHVDPGEIGSSSGSNFGSKYVDLLAPGKLVCSLGQTGYAYACGSSQATPQVTAAAAMLWTQLRVPAALRARLIYTADWKAQYEGRVWGGLLNVKNAASFPLINLLTTLSESEPHQIVLDGNARVDVDGTELRRDTSRPVFHEQIPFSRVLRMVAVDGGLHRLFLLRTDSSMAVVEAQVSGRVRCRSLTHYDSNHERFGAKPHPPETCNPGIEANQIKDYIAATPVTVQF